VEAWTHSLVLWKRGGRKETRGGLFSRKYFWQATFIVLGPDISGCTFSFPQGEATIICIFPTERTYMLSVFLCVS
jgi:hypothetical protein